MRLLRVNLLSDFSHHGETGERVFTAGVRAMPEDAAQDAAAAGLLGALPKKAPAKVKTPAKAKA